MDGCDGLVREAALAAKKENRKLVSVVTKSSSYNEFEDDFILEPVYTMPTTNCRQLWTYASLAYEAFLDDDETFTYYVRPDYIHVPINDIQYFASEGRRTHIVSKTSRDTFYQKLDEIERLIKTKEGHFIRIHKSYLVNSRFISCYNRDCVVLNNGERLRISRYEYYRKLDADILANGLNIKRIANYY
jgi:DNA-binding LytR/AlgR family response regulator